MVYLNHGSFGSCPLAVLEYQRRLRERMESRPMQFLVRDLEELLDQARSSLARFVGADSEDLVFIPNATTGVNTVLRSLRWEIGTELLVTDHEYNACRNALEYAAGCSSAKVKVVSLPFPFEDERQLIEPLLAAVSNRTRLALLDHVSSQTGIVFPIQRLVGELEGRGVEVLVDGAHAPGMVPLDLRRLGVTYYTGNCHKWLCAPKGAAFLYVTRERQSSIRPLSISHGANSPRKDRSRFQLEFGWTGTHDPSAFLSVPEALQFMGGLLPGGWPEVIDRNHALALAARRVLCDKLGIQVPCPDASIGAMASVPIPDAPKSTRPSSPLYSDLLQDRLCRIDGIEVPVISWPAPPKRLLRVSAQLYNSLPQYERLAEALMEAERQPS
ncbi:MAG: aminotransferase class V-fold PLP-dependent enzyme [Candidatus Omnitrophica bacterium]|nr:aminotransferase class V-fold PLP-dependent enzyme [Candidatus Omnitrophota bacterium]